MSKDAWSSVRLPLAVLLGVTLIAGACSDDEPSSDTSTTETTEQTDGTAIDSDDIQPDGTAIDSDDIQPDGTAIDSDDIQPDGTAIDSDDIQPDGTAIDSDDIQPDEDSTGDRSIYGVDFSGLELPEGDPHDSYELVEDDTQQIEVEVPTDWNDVDTTVAEREGRDVPGIWASTDIEALDSGYSVPGLQLDLRTVTSTDTALALLNSDNATTEVCGDLETFDYDDGRYQGVAELWTDCGEDGAALLQLVVLRAGNQYVTSEIQMLSDADIDAAVRALETFTAVDIESGEQWEQGDDSTTQSVGELFTMAVASNSSVGDLWRVGSTHDTAVVQFLYEDYEPDNPEPEAGGGGTVFFTFEALAPGTTTITLENCFQCDTNYDGTVDAGEGEVTEFGELEVTVE